MGFAFTPRELPKARSFSFTPRIDQVDELPYFSADTPEKCEQAVSMLEGARIIGFDTETYGSDVKEEHPFKYAQALSLQLASETHRVFVPLWQDKLPNLRYFKSLLESPKRRLVAHNFKYDWQILKNHGINATGILGDTLAMDRIYYSDEFRQHGLKDCARRYFGDVDAVDFKATFSDPVLKKDGTPKKGPGILVPLDQWVLRGPEAVKTFVTYAMKDADLTVKLFKMLAQELEKMPWLPGGEGKTMFDYYVVRRDYPLVLGRMERRGAPVNQARLLELQKAVHADEVRHHKDFVKACLAFGLHEDYVKNLNLNSPPQIGHLLEVELEIPDLARNKATKKGEEGSVKTGDKVLETLADERTRPILNPLRAYRKTKKLGNDFIDKLVRLGERFDGVIHGYLNEGGTITGRLSASLPNLQQIPNAEKDPYGIRECFEPYEGEVLVDIDLSQVEVRVCAHVTQDPVLLQAIREGWDIHALTAHKLHPIIQASMRDAGFECINRESLEWVKKNFPKERKNAKPILFGQFYGMGPDSLAVQTDVSVLTAKRNMGEFFELYAGLRRGMDKTHALAEKLGYVNTLLGRKIHLPHIRFRGSKEAAKRQSFNYCIQGPVSDIMMFAMIAIDRDEELRALGVKMFLQVHDELLFSMPPESVERAIPILKHYMTQSLDVFGFAPLDVELEADAGHGPNWAEAKN